MTNNNNERPDLPAVIGECEAFFSELRLLRKKPVIWVYGLMGSGKTTLVNLWLHREHLPCLWYRMGPKDHQVNHFFQMLSVAALNINKESNLILPVFHKADSERLDEFARQFFSALFAQLPPEMVIVIDDAHFMMQGLACKEIVRAAAEQLVSDSQIILIKRTAPTQHCVAFCLEDTVGVTGGKLLVWSDATVRDVAKQRGIFLSSDTSDELCRRFSGWATGLSMWLERSSTPGELKNVDKFIQKAVFPYFGKIFEQLHPLTRQWMLNSTDSKEQFARDQLNANDANNELLLSLATNTGLIDAVADSDAPYCFHPLFREFLEHHHEPKIFHNISDTQPAHITRSVHSLIPTSEKSIWIYCLGRFSLLRDGKPILFGQKVQKKPLAFLKCLLALGGRDVRITELVDNLWPGVDADFGYRSAISTLHRLRHLLAHAESITLADSKVSLNPKYCWVDIWVFERCLSAINIHHSGNLALSNQERTELEQALDIYHGDFLKHDGDETWLIICRERLRSKFIRAVCALASVFEAACDWRNALDCYEHGLDVEQLVEAFYCGAMRCQMQLGLSAEALGIYQSASKILELKFGIPPSQSLQRLKQQILASSSS